MPKVGSNGLVPNINRQLQNLKSAPVDRANGRIGSLDGIRALACLWVVAHHICKLVKDPQPRLLYDLGFMGKNGVCIFFVLSGMLLSLPFWRALSENRPLPSLRIYAEKRLRRIVPAFVVCMLISFGVSLFSGPGPYWVVRLLTGLFFVNSYSPVTFFPSAINTPLWSIGVEMQFYLFLGILMALMFRLKDSVPGAIFWILTTVVFWVGSVATVTWFGTRMTLAESDRTIRLALEWLPGYIPPGLFLHFVLGVFAGYGYVRISRFLTGRVIPRQIFDCVIGAVMLLPLVFKMVRVPSWTAVGYGWPWFPASIAAIVTVLPFSTVVGPLLSGTFFRATARLSYGIYIYHFMIIGWLTSTFPLFRVIDRPAKVVLLGGTSLVLSYLAAAVSYRFVEAPFLSPKDQNGKMQF